ncbi:helix-turn-helix transcriptional regulator [uncultured Chryseobacterium sp.]|uniref:helix-turn-helix domain-containing protein n=1 Tax=uncultured Chryseobacterium sp. TaxID=259322 RepID=UPI0025FFF41F|nr:helix-turn-helix transcriptional regulator [uncultured Chryseobacterium sp.]
MKKIFSFDTYQFDFNLIEHIKSLRKSHKWSQEELSSRMGVSKNFVGNVESYTQPQKYSTRHIGLLAKAFGYKNISELMDFPTPEHDRIKVTVKQVYNESGTRVMESEVVKIEGIE